MGISGKWLKTLVGLRKSEKSHDLAKYENVGKSAFNFFTFNLVFSGMFVTTLVRKCMHHDVILVEVCTKQNCSWDM